MATRIIRIITEVLCILLLLGTIAFLIVFWKDIPASVPTHFDGSGQIESYAAKKTLIFNPILMAVAYVPLSFVKTMRYRSFGKKEVRVPAPPLLFPLMKLTLLAGFAYTTVCCALVRPLGAWYLPVFLTLALGPMVVFSVRALPQMMQR